MGSTTVPALANRSKSSLNAHSSAVHVEVKASGKKASSAFVLPRRLESVTSSPAVDGSVKSGARSPTCSAIEGAVVVTTQQSPASGGMPFGTHGEQSALRGECHKAAPGGATHHAP